MICSIEQDNIKLRQQVKEFEKVITELKEQIRDMLSIVKNQKSE